ncbi:MAG: exodeoxyribonuclease V subunit alpha [Waddliaceae bacterium]
MEISTGSTKQKRSQLRLPSSRGEPPAVRWPRLFHALQEGVFSYVDVALAEKLLSHTDNPSEEAAGFLCYLSRATRQGHVCVSVEGSDVAPPPFDEGTAEVLQAAGLSVPQGAAALPLSLVTEVDRWSEPVPSTPLCRCGHRYYFQKYWVDESLFFKQLSRLRSSEPALPLRVDKKQMEGLNAEQMQAVHCFSKNSLTLICGGPGTGKTYTAGQLIKIFWDSLSADQRKRCEIALAAPTGKAAANLHKSLHNAIGSLKEFPAIQSKTLHALMGRQTAKQLTADLILVDECSMVDLHLMAQFLSSIKKGARVALIGDPFQLPPVEVGAPFADVVSSGHPCLAQHLVTINTCVRTERQELLDFAKAIQEGCVEKVFNLLASSVDIEFLDNEKDILSRAFSAFPSPSFCGQNPKGILESFHHFRLLSPLRKGPFGVDNMNQRLLQHMKKWIKKDQWLAPIMITSNNYGMELFNGDVGVLVCSPSTTQINDDEYALFPSHNKGVRKIPARVLPAYDYAYCLSVHKSQGCEFDSVLLLMPEGSEHIGREGLYTAATRTRKKLAIWGDRATIAKTLERNSRRQSGVAHLIAL